MSDVRFTPGPWRVEIIAPYQGTKSLIGASIVGRNSGTLIAEIRGAVCVGGEPHEENSANANLISAAPDLFEACRQAVTLFEDDEGIAQVLMRALAKAEPK